VDYSLCRRLKTETAGLYETLVPIYGTTRRHKTHHHNHNTYRVKILKLQKKKIFQYFSLEYVIRQEVAKNNSDRDGPYYNGRSTTNVTFTIFSFHFLSSDVMGFAENAASILTIK